MKHALEIILEHPDAEQILSAVADILAAVKKTNTTTDSSQRREAQATALNARGRFEEVVGMGDIRRERLIVAAGYGSSEPGAVADQNLISRIFSKNVLKTEVGQIGLRFAMAQFFYDEKYLIDRQPLNEINGQIDTSPSLSGAIAAHFLTAAKGYRGLLSDPELPEDNSFLSAVDKQGKIEFSGPADTLRYKTITRLGYTCGFIGSQDKPRDILKLAAAFFNTQAKILNGQGYKIKTVNWATVRQWAKSSSEKRHASLSQCFNHAFEAGKNDAHAKVEPNPDLFFKPLKNPSVV